MMHHRSGTGRLLVVLTLAVVVVASTVVPLQASPDHGAALDESGAGGFIGLNPEGGLDTGGIISVGEPTTTEEGTEPARPQYQIENGGDCIADEIENADGSIEPVLGTTWLTRTTTPTRRSSMQSALSRHHLHPRRRPPQTRSGSSFPWPRRDWASTRSETV